MYVGLSAPCIQSQRKSQPGCSAVGNEEQVLEDGPPYCAPHTAEVAFHSVEQPSNCPNPPPGIYIVSQCSRSRKQIDSQQDQIAYYQRHHQCWSLVRSSFFR